MAAEFNGYTDVQHVQQPEDSELCFASIVSAMTGAEIEAAHEALKAAGLSEDDGSTGPMGETVLEVEDSKLTITPFQSPFEGAEDPEGVLALIDEQFVAGRAVTLLYKKTPDPEDGRHHWTLFTGSFDLDDRKGAIHTIDPLEEAPKHLGRHVARDMIARSMDYAGVYAFALTAEHAPAAQEA